MSSERQRPPAPRVDSSLEEPRQCSACGGHVDVMTIVKPLSGGRYLPAKIGACLRCGQWFNEAGLLELPKLPKKASRPPSAT